MLKAIIKLLTVFLGFTFCFVSGKMIFLAFNPGIYSGIGAGDVVDIIANGFSMDLSMAGYFSIVPALLLCVASAIGSKGIIERLMNIYFIVTSLIISFVTLTDAALYSYWQFKLDSTPLFISSPLLNPLSQALNGGSLFFFLAFGSYGQPYATFCSIIWQWRKPVSFFRRKGKPLFATSL